MAEILRAQTQYRMRESGRPTIGMSLSSKFSQFCLSWVSYVVSSSSHSKFQITINIATSLSLPHFFFGGLSCVTFTASIVVPPYRIQ